MYKYNTMNNMSNDNNINNVTVSVSEFNETIKIILQQTCGNDVIHVQGTISNYRVYGSTIYFTIKDTNASLNCCKWTTKNNNDTFKIGDNVTVSGTVTVYPKMGYYQLNAKNITKTTLISMVDTYDALRDKYDKLGYFNKKRQITKYLDNICIITSLEGAAVQDIMTTLKKGSYTGKVTIKHALVQGKDCPSSVNNSINMMDKLGFDLIIVTRGGGNYDDLAGFNDKLILDALYNAKTLTVSAVGHEIDNLLSDLVADIRTPTPTGAGSLVLQYKIDVRIYDDLIYTTNKLLKKKLVLYLDALQSCKNKMAEINKTIITNKTKKYINLINQSKNLIYNNIYEYKSQLQQLKHNLDTIKTTKNIKHELTQNKMTNVSIIDANGIYVTSKYMFDNNKKNDIKMSIIFTDGIVYINN